MQNKEGVTIGIPVYNEEKNIQRLLKSLAIQKNVNIDQTIIVNDGSTDNTTAKIHELNTSIKNKLNLHIINLEKNMGKANALNIIFNKANSEILIILDADVILIKSNTLEELLRCFQMDKNIGLVSGWYIMEPLKSTNIIARAYRFSNILLENLSKKKPLYSATGAIMALHKSIYKKLSLPHNVVRDDAYIYLYTVKNGKKYVFCPNARVIIPIYEKMTTKTFLYRQLRATRIPKVFVKEFGQIAIDELKINPSIAIKSFIKSYIKQPFDGTIYLILKVVSSIYKRLSTNTSVRIHWKNYEK
ncbi:glycosyltransferase [Pyrobaculum calidifontis]|uniref:Glycosyl transferase, family 2 n=1 Tax=Pyrobaculum calidifontis (strain DSM 21063 / JCM 11548 / VA1) TaxID=410359 RepID=A3MTE8_PYRCJ|nr:glycosyltransferase [Pyrobaculum calidifontis]ABO07915.1 glycosyl transferase, family 2 [Pyrobaculum calidifontis JCM 11548]